MMQITRFKIQYLPTTILIIVALFLWMISCGDLATADIYTDSAHGNTSYGVNRSGTECPTGTPCPTGDCAHCHDTFDESICGVNERMLFRTQFDNQSSGFCISCHRGANSVQVTGYINNYDYSTTRGGKDEGCPESIRKAFKFINNTTRVPQMNCGSTVGSAHDLKNIRGYMTGKWDWGDTNPELNPCGACHNPHQATKEYPCSLPSSHTGTWEIWGDENGEKMADYLGVDLIFGTGEIYEPPYKVGMAQRERDAVDASTQPNYVTLCLECHQDRLNSSQHGTVGGANFTGIDWSAMGIDAAIHGKSHDYGSSRPGSLKPPYTGVADWENTNFVLCCTDCHEPHGSRNEWLLRTEVNGKSDIEVNFPGGWFEFCTACHSLPEDSGHAHCPDIDEFKARSCNFDECHMHGHLPQTL